METSTKIDLTKVKQEPMETEIRVKTENVPETDNNFQPKLESINTDIIQYEGRDFPSAKIKCEPSLPGDHNLNNYEEQQTVVKLKLEEVTKDTAENSEISESSVHRLETLAPDKILLTTESDHHKEHVNDTWTPIPLSELVGLYSNSDTSNWSIDLNDSNVSDINEQSVEERTCTDLSTYEQNRNTENITANSERQVFLHENNQLIVQTTDSSRNKHDLDVHKPRESIKRTIITGNTSTTFKDPNKVLDQSSYIYRKKGTHLKDTSGKSSLARTFGESSDTSIYAETLRQSMEKKQLIFINKRTKQRRETFLTYFDDFGIEVIIASYKGTDKIELYNRSEDPNTFYRLFYNFAKAGSNEPKPPISDKEVQAVSKYMKECKHQEKNADCSSKRPRLTTEKQPNQDSGLGIIRSARQLRKLGRGFATENYYKRHEEKQSRDKTEHRNSYWVSQGRQNISKDN